MAKRDAGLAVLLSLGLRSMALDVIASFMVHPNASRDTLKPVPPPVIRQQFLIGNA